MKENHQLTQEQYNSKLSNVADLAVNYAKTGFGLYSMRTAFNELCECSGANKCINHESTIGRRKLLVQSVCIQAISRLSREDNQSLENQLNKIAEDYTEARSRGLRR